MIDDQIKKFNEIVDNLLKEVDNTQMYMKKLNLAMTLLVRIYKTYPHIFWCELISPTGCQHWLIIEV